MKAQDSIPLYPNGVPNAANIPGGGRQGVKSTMPALSVFLPANGNGTAVVICPGGGYGHLAMDKEGYLVAREFNKLGVAAFVLKYRLPDDKTMQDKTIGPLQDAQAAIKMVRERAKEWNIDTHRVGIAGFSAGGHLASTAGTHFNRPVIENKLKTSLRPDFMILIYPVISFTDSLTHQGSRNNLIGKEPSAELVELYSNEYQVTAQTPPAFLVHAGDDKTVKVLNSIVFYTALQKNGVEAEMLIYPHGGHGFGLYNKTTEDKWMERCRDWMKSNGWL
jgi:acetyl esterase/lipase